MRLKSVVLSFLLMNNYLLANSNEKLISSEKTPTALSNVESLKNFLNKNYSTFLVDKKILKDYYELNNYKAFWFEQGKLKEIGYSLVEKVKNDPVLKTHIDEKLKLNQVTEVLNKLGTNSDDKIKAEFMLTELFDKYSSYLLNGSINWKGFKEKLSEIEKTYEIDGQWDKYENNQDSKRLLKKAIEANDLSVAFQKLDFTYPNAQKLIGAITDLEKIVKNGDYVKLPEIKSLRLGDVSSDVKVLRKRLAQSNDLNKTCEGNINVKNIVTNTIQQESTQQQTPTSCEEVFDEDVQNGVMSFQKTHGLNPDGIVGLQTQRFLNTSAKERIRQIRLNLERMRWLPRNFGEQYLIINIPDYRLKMIEENSVKLNMAVIVGETKHPTPIFSDNMSYVVLNPTWNIPENIAKKEILPKLMKDPNYLASKGIDIYQSWNQSEKVQTHEVLDTMILQDAEAVPNFRFAQGPGDENPLGKMKFMFPNKHAVYLHDTPMKSLFNNARRAYSHGCIRLSKPDLLLSTIASDNKNINLDKVNEILKQENEKSIGLNKKIPVHIIYLTSWVDDDGKLQFREDIYNYDKLQKEFL